MKTNRATRPGLSLSFVLIGVLFLFLPVLAFFQYRWIGQVSEAERERLVEGLDIASHRLVEDILRQFSNVALSFQLQPTAEADTLEEQLFRKLEHWHTTAPFPEIVRSVYVSTLNSRGELVLNQFGPVFGSLDTTEWPKTMEGLKFRLDRITNFQLANSSGRPFDWRFNTLRDTASDPVDGYAVWVLVPLVRPTDLSVANVQRPLAD